MKRFGKHVRLLLAAHLVLLQAAGVTVVAPVRVLPATCVRRCIRSSAKDTDLLFKSCLLTTAGIQRMQSHQE